MKEEEEKERRLKSATSETVASEISIIGEDQNIHQKSVHKAIEEVCLIPQCVHHSNFNQGPTIS